MHPSMIAWIDDIRRAELEMVLQIAGPFIGRVLEIGGGTGVQAAAIQAMGHSVESIDIAGSSYRSSRVFPIVEYDGHSIPFSDEAFDTIFSSNVLEHVAHIDAFQTEMMRVLKPGAHAIHVMPSHTWRTWTILAHYPGLAKLLRDQLRSDSPTVGISAPFDEADRSPGRVERIIRLAGKAVFADRHGERGNRLTELWYFRPTWWRDNFERAGWIVEKAIPVPLFYTGYGLLGRKLSLRHREWLANFAGSASTCFVVRKP